MVLQTLQSSGLGFRVLRKTWQAKKSNYCKAQALTPHNPQTPIPSRPQPQNNITYKTLDQRYKTLDQQKAKARIEALKP